MTQAADSSVCIPALLEDHQHHAAAEAALSRAESTIGHAAIETYSVLTRLPPPLRMPALHAAALVSRALPRDWISLDGDAHAKALIRLAEMEIAGGAAYDGIIALTASRHGATLVTLDKRASRTYTRLGVAFELLA